jgi:methylated-DNA-[protein]-cysteine S-methyltransferase
MKHAHKQKNSTRIIKHATTASLGMHYFDGLTTPVGRLHIVVSDKALIRIYFPGDTWSDDFVREPTHPLIVRTKKELKEYFSGKRKYFTVPLAVSGTVFQEKAWNVLRAIPYGETISYSEQAKRLRQQNAVRAVGSANGKNPIPIIVPCHRVVAKDVKLGGSLRGRNSTGIFMVASLPKNLGGYAGGLSVKKKLLALEQRFSR